MKRSLIIVGLLFAISMFTLAQGGIAEAEQVSHPEEEKLTAVNDTYSVFVPLVIYQEPYKDMVYVPAGEFQMGCHPAFNDGYPCPSDELPLHTVHLDDFYIDKYEVTNAQYAECVAAGDCYPPDITISFTRDPYYGNPTYENYPLIYITWNRAVMYRLAQGKRLPSEAEWEKAARGSTARALPWGDSEPNCSLANFGSCVGDTSEVGSYPLGASPYGALDMAGNAAEWVNDWYAEGYYNTYHPYSWPSNPTGPSSGAGKVLRGGYWDESAASIRTARRHAMNPNHGHYPYFGFRCVADP